MACCINSSVSWARIILHDDLFAPARITVSAKRGAPENSMPQTNRLWACTRRFLDRALWSLLILLGRLTRHAILGGFVILFGAEALCDRFFQIDHLLNQQDYSTCIAPTVAGQRGFKWKQSTA